jgi:mRNA interferase HigB
MRVISKRRLREFWDEYPESHPPLLGWYRVARRADWATLADIRRLAASASLYQSCVILNIGGNKFRLVVRALYNIRRVYVVGVFTHAEYDEDQWKCEC